MPTIRKRKTKKGVVYDIQVKIKEFSTQKYIYKTTTWRLEELMTPKREKLMCLKFAEQFEQNMINLYSASKLGSIRHNIKVVDYAQLWLERIHKDFSLRYYELSIRNVKWICRYLGGYKVTEVTPFKIQSFFDKLDQESYTTYTVHAKPELREVMNAKHIQYVDFRYKYKINSGSLAHALNGKNISLKYAQSMADILGVKIEYIFFIESTTKLYSSNTIEKIKRATRCIFAMAKRQRLVEHNYASADYISYGRHPKRSVNYLDDQQAKQLLEALMSCEDVRIKTAFIILLFTGMRRGELTGLEWKDLNFEERTLSICRTGNYSKLCGHYTKAPKTEGSVRTISLSETVINQLLEYREWYLNYRENLGRRWVETDRLFTGEHGGPISPESFESWLRILRRDFNIPHFTIHGLRHTNITIQIAAGVPLTTVSCRAGHSRTSTTTDIYAHFIKTSDRQAADALDAVLNKKIYQKIK